VYFNYKAHHGGLDAEIVLFFICASLCFVAMLIVARYLLGPGELIHNKVMMSVALAYMIAILVFTFWWGTIWRLDLVIMMGLFLLLMGLIMRTTMRGDPLGYIHDLMSDVELQSSLIVIAILISFTFLAGGCTSLVVTRVMALVRRWRTT
jgi:hypothetical protein